MPVEVTRELIAPGRPNRPGTPLKPRSVTIHNTANTNRGANAAAHSKFVRNKGYYELRGKKHWVSWHYVVDDKQVIQQIPLNEQAWHAGAANAASVAIEICMHSDMNEAQAYDNAAALVATLVTDLELVASDIVTHQSWTGKNCPQVLLVGDRWQRFVNRIGQLVHASGMMEATLAIDPEEVEAALKAEPAVGEQNEIHHSKLRDAVNEYRKSKKRSRR